MKNGMLIVAVLFCAVGSVEAGILNAVDPGAVVDLINSL